MLLLVVIVSALPWLPTPLSIQGLLALGVAALFSRMPVLAILALITGVQEIRIQDRLLEFAPESWAGITCEGRMQVIRVLSGGDDFRRFEGLWLEGECDPKWVGERMAVSLNHPAAISVGDEILGRFRMKPFVALVNQGGFDIRRHALGEGWNRRASALSYEVIEARGLRARLNAQVRQWPQPLQGLTLALVFGEKDRLDAELKSIFEQLGLAHLLAISGLHVGIVLGVFWFAFKRLGWPRHPRAAVTIRTAVLAGLAWAVADWTLYSPSVVRAGVMAVCLSAWSLWAVKGSLAGALALTIGAVVIWDPLSTLAVGFLMSAGAVALIAALSWARPVRNGLGLIRMQLGFSWLMAPVLSLSAGFVYPWLGMLANLLVVPSLPMVLAILLVLTAWPVSSLIEALNGALGWATVHTLEALQQTMFAGEVSNSVLVMLMGLGGVSLLPHTWPRWMLAAIFVLGLNVFPKSTSTHLIVHDVGQGSAASLHTPLAQAIYDLGAGQPDAWSRMNQVLPSLDRFRPLQVSVSHADMDHIGGLSDLLQQFSLPERIEGGGSLPGLLASCAPRLLDDAQITVLWPTEAVFHDEENHRSCVLLIEAHGTRLLLMGDADWLAEAWVVRTLMDLGLLGLIDAVVVSHHGASNGSSPSLVRAVGARWALISVGRHNRYGHPKPEVVQRWMDAGAQVFRTDQDGAIYFSFETQTIRRAREYWPTRWNLKAVH